MIAREERPRGPTWLHCLIVATVSSGRRYRVSPLTTDNSLDAPGEESLPLPSLLRNRPLLTVMSGHFAVDHFSGLLPALYPLLVATQGLTVAEVGVIASAYQSTLSLTQPFFGYLADRIGTRWLSGLSVLWMALAFAALGWAPSFAVLVFLAAAAGLGSGAYHPQGAMNASFLTNARERNTAMAIYTLGGTGGLAIGPLVGAAVLGAFGPRATPLLAVPATLIALWLFVEMRRIEGLKRAAQPATATPRPARRGNTGALVRIVAALMIRSAGYFALTTFLTVWFQSLGYGSDYYSLVLSTLLLSAVAGTAIGGLLADRLGRQRVMLFALFALGPLMFLFVQAVAAPAPVVLALGFLTGLMADAPVPLALVTAQQLMPGKVGVASGLILGFTFSAGGLGALLVGWLAAGVGLPTALSLAAILPLLAALLFLTIPGHVMAPEQMPAALRET
jgi:FSR family fosmidomycin resistance protein-like MFS transporter